MTNDISACNGCIGKVADQLQYCPLRHDCLRHKLFQDFENERKPGGVWMVIAGYKDGKCELQIKIDDETRNQIQR